uniref:Uncharacterized protein n=1 Tax=viral metagenome TaxID=1070528 RepID=A0A6H2A1V3_9ZZZZ
MTSEERGVWVDIIALAGEIGQDGKICDNDGRPLPRDFIANQLNIKQILLDRVIAKCGHEGRISGTDPGETLQLANWSRYQSEYDRQKKYRQDKPESPAPRSAPAPKPEPEDRFFHAPAFDTLSRWEQLIAKKEYPQDYGARTPEEDQEYLTLQAERKAQSAALLAKLKAEGKLPGIK